MNDTRQSVPTTLPELVDRFTRHTELVKMQLAALGALGAESPGDVGSGIDLDAFDRLAAARIEIADEIDAGPSLTDLIAAYHQGGDEKIEADAESGATDAITTLIARAREALASGLDAERAVRRRLLELREANRDALEELNGREVALRRYLQSDGITGTLVDLNS